MRRCFRRNRSGQFSILAAMFVAVILISSVMMTYQSVRYSSNMEEPHILSAIDETNLALKQVLGFTVGYYGSVLQVTGNSTYARTLADRYLMSGLENVADIRPEWGSSFDVTGLELSNNWFMNESYSKGTLNVTYSLTGLEISGIAYSASLGLNVTIFSSDSSNKVCLNVTRDEGEPINDLGKQNFEFYRYRYGNSTWEMASPTTEPVAFSNGTYLIDIPTDMPEINPYAYIIQVKDTRGITVAASSYSHYTSTFTFNSTYADDLHFVEGYMTDVDNSPNKGERFDFTAQQSGPNENYDILTEENVGTVTNDYWPDNYNPLGSTLVNGTPTDLRYDDGSYMNFSSLSSGTSSQTLFAHQDTTSIAGQSYRWLMYGSADAAGTTITQQMSSSRVLLAKSVFSLQGISSIPASIWTINYRAWKDASSSGNPTSSPTSTCGTWINPTNAYVDGGSYAYSSGAGNQQDYDYGIWVPSGSEITEVRVRLDAYRSGGDGNDKILLEVFDGTTWLQTSQELTLTTSQSTYWIDVTGWTSWTVASANSIQTRVTHIRYGSSTDEVRLDWIPAEVTYTAPVLTNSPSSTSGAWTNGARAYSDDSLYATSDAGNEQQIYYGYGFNLPSDATVVQVRVRMDAWTSGNDDIRLHVSSNDGSSWLSSSNTRQLSGSQQTYWVDVTSWTSWTPTNLDDIRARVTHIKDSSTNNVYLDWIPIEVTYTTKTTGSPTSTLSPCWNNPTNAYADDSNYAYSTSTFSRQTYGGYGFSIPLGTSITQVQVRLDAWCPSGDDDVQLEVSTDGGVTWLSSTHQYSLPSSDQNNHWVDVTSWTSWTQDKINSDNIRVRISHIAVGNTNEVRLDWIPIKVTYAEIAAHSDVDVLIRKSDGSVRTTIATNVAASADLSSAQQTLSGTYAWPGYTVVDQTDYLEIDFYVDPAVSCSLNAYLRLDDNTLPESSQTRIVNMMLPSEQTCTLELYGPSNLNPWNSLFWSISAKASTSGVSVTYQLYNNTSHQYPGSGDGYLTTSLGTSEVLSSATINGNSTDFRDSTGRWSLRITAVKQTSTPFLINFDQVKFRPGSAVYALDLEENWAHLNMTLYQPTLCIKTGNLTAGDTLAVDFWNATVMSWQNILPNLNPNSWNNKTIDINPPMLTIRFRSSDANDFSPGSWQLDAVLFRSSSHQEMWQSMQSSEAVLTVEVMQNGTMRWLGQELRLMDSGGEYIQGIPIPPVPVKAIHVNQTIAGADSVEVPFQIEDWGSNYKVPLGLTNSETVFGNRQMIVTLIDTRVSEFTIWWNGSDSAIQTPLAYENSPFSVEFDDDHVAISNGVQTLQVIQDSFTVSSTVNGVSTTTNFMRVNDEASVYGAGSAPVIHNGTVRNIIQQEAEWGTSVTGIGGADGCPNLYANIVLILPARATYFTYQLRFMFMASNQSRNIDDLCPVKAVSSIDPDYVLSETEDGVYQNTPIVSNRSGTFTNTDSPWTPHHWSQLSDGDKGSGIMFTDTNNQMLYYFDAYEYGTGALKISNTTRTIEVLPVSGGTVSFQSPLDVTWYGAVVTFHGTYPIYMEDASGMKMGLWIFAELPPTITVTVDN